MRKIRKSTWLPLALFLYTTAMAVYFLPRNTQVSDTEKYVTLTLSYVIIFLLWRVLRWKEKRQNKPQ